MWKVTRKGLLAHKVRFLLTAFAVVLGVVVHGRNVRVHRHDPADLRRSVRRTSTRTPTPVVRSTQVSEESLRRRPTRQRARVAARTKSHRRRASPVPIGTVQGPYAQIVDANGKAVGTRARDRRPSASAGTRPRAEPVPPRTREPRRRDRRRDRRRPRSGEQGAPPRRRPGHGADAEAAEAVHARRYRALRYRRQPRGRIGGALLRERSPADRGRARDSSTRSPCSPSPACRQHAAQGEPARTLSTQVEVLTGKEITKETQDNDRQRSSVSSTSRCWCSRSSR